MRVAMGNISGQQNKISDLDRDLTVSWASQSLGQGTTPQEGGITSKNLLALLPL